MKVPLITISISALLILTMGHIRAEEGHPISFESNWKKEISAPRNQEYQRVAYVCKGIIDKKFERRIVKAGLLVEDFEKGIGCIPGDFDGNFSTDFAIFKAVENDCAFGSFEVKGLFFDSEGLAHTSQFGELCALEFSQCEGCAPNGKDGIYEKTGADTDYIHYFNQGEKKWQSLPRSAP